MLTPISAGTSALKVCILLLRLGSLKFTGWNQGDFTRTGKRDLAGMLNDGMNSLAR